MEELTPQVKLIYDCLLQEIQHSPVGVPVSSMAELRSKFNVGQLTVQRAYDALEAMGRIKRIPRKGVFVDNPVETGEIAIVISQSVLQPGESHYYSQTVAALVAEISSQSRNLQVRLHVFKDLDVKIKDDINSLAGFSMDKHASFLGLDDIETLRRLRGVIVFHTIGKLHDKLIERGIPVFYLEPEHSPYVAWDKDYFYRKVLEYAVSAGLRDVCFFGFSGWTAEPKRKIKKFEDLMKEYGLVPNPNWNIFLPHRMLEQVGYEMFNRLWDIPQKPQLIIAIDDIACVGLLKAVNKRKLDIPRDFRLLTWANANNLFPYSKEISRYEVDGFLQASKTVELMLKQLENGTIDEHENVLLKPVFIEGETL